MQGDHEVVAEKRFRLQECAKGGQANEATCADAHRFYKLRLIHPPCETLNKLRRIRGAEVKSVHI